MPPDFVFGAGTSSAFAPVSCTAGAGFCVAVVSDSALINPVTFTMEPADVVTTNGGQSWTGYTNMTAGVTSLSCVTSHVCWGVTLGQFYPQVSETTDGGQTWTLLPPGALGDGNTSWQPSTIDCVSVTTCWVAGETSAPAAPMMAETTDGGTTWTIFSNLPAITPYDRNGTYALNGLSCVSALSCVAVGGLVRCSGTRRSVPGDAIQRACPQDSRLSQHQLPRFPATAQDA